jgi:hypothetical protein
MLRETLDIQIRAPFFVHTPENLDASVASLTGRFKDRPIFDLQGSKVFSLTISQSEPKTMGVCIRADSFFVDITQL